MGDDSRSLVAMYEAAVPLTRGVASDLPRRPGIYAAWILDPRALRQAGIDGPAPLLLYVGKATSLRSRLGPRAEVMDIAPHELLAARGQVLWLWGARAKKRDGRTKRWKASAFACRWHSTKSSLGRNAMWSGRGGRPVPPGLRLTLRCGPSPRVIRFSIRSGVRPKLPSCGEGTATSARARGGCGT